LTGPLPPRALVARFLAAVIRPPLVFFMWSYLLFSGSECMDVDYEIIINIRDWWIEWH
jgi:hypothetical protein